MNLVELIRLQALKLKQLNTAGSDMPDKLLEIALQQNPDQKELRNICALVSTSLFDRVEQTCNFLEISKRRFVEAALIDALEKASLIINEVNPLGEVS